MDAHSQVLVYSPFGPFIPLNCPAAGMADCAASVYRNGGIAPFFRGAIALVVRGVLVNAVVFWSYEKIFKGLEHTAQK